MIIKNKSLKVTLALIIWLIFWVAPYKIFDFLPDMAGRNEIFITYTLLGLVLPVIALIVWKNKFNNFFFLKIKDKRILWLYIMPIIFIIRALCSATQFGINSVVWTSGIITSTFLTQDLMTFGFLQTYLEKLVKPFIAFLLTSSLFFIGHIFTNGISTGLLIVLVGSLVFGFLRYKTKNIYLLNIIHTSFLLFG